MEDNFTQGEWRTWAPLGEALYAHVLGPDTPVTGPIRRADAVRIVKCYMPLRDIPNELLDDCTITAVTPQEMEAFFVWIGEKDAALLAAQELVQRERSEISTLRQQLEEARKEIQELKNKKPLRPPFA